MFNAVQMMINFRSSSSEWLINYWYYNNVAKLYVCHTMSVMFVLICKSLYRYEIV